MTEIKINKQKNMIEVHIQGHSGYGEEGKDIVCAAISTLGFTLVNRLENLHERGYVREFEYKQNDGELYVMFKGLTVTAIASFETIEIGFLMLAENFSKFISVSGEKIEN